MCEALQYHPHVLSVYKLQECLHIILDSLGHASLSHDHHMQCAEFSSFGTNRTIALAKGSTSADCLLT